VFHAAYCPHIFDYRLWKNYLFLSVFPSLIMYLLIFLWSFLTFPFFFL
jgi:hypothetical protein